MKTAFGLVALPRHSYGPRKVTASTTVVNTDISVTTNYFFNNYSNVILND